MSEAQQHNDPDLRTLSEFRTEMSIADLPNDHRPVGPSVEEGAYIVRDKVSSESERTKSLEIDNKLLKRLLADALLENAALRRAAKLRGWTERGLGPNATESTSQSICLPCDK